MMVRLLLALLAVLWGTAAVAAEQPSYGPPSAWVKDAELPTPKADEGGAVQFLLRDIQIRASGDGVESYARGAVEIRTVQGLSAMGNIAVVWSPQSDTLTIHHVRIVRGGQVIDAVGKPGAFTILRREQNLERSMLDGVLTASFQPSDLRVGDILDFAFTLHRNDPAFKGHNEQFSANMLDEPARRVRLRAVWPKGRPVRWRAAEGLPKPKLSTTGGETELLIDMSDVQPVKIPASAPPRFSEVGYLEITEFGAWKDISALMASPYEAAMTLGPDSPLKAEIAKIRAASNDPKTQAVAALRLVQDQVRYVFQGMENGYLPASADETWSRRFGDCKGKSALLAAILRELGIKAEPALVSLSRSDGLENGLPLMQRFDHVIVRTVIDGKVYWLDGARTGDRLLDAQPSAVHRWALPMRAGGADLERLPPPTLLKPDMVTELHLDASGGLDVPAPVRGALTLSGDAATVSKASYDNLAGADRETFLRDFWKEAYSWIDIQKAGFTYDDASGDARLSFEGTADMEWAGATGGLRRYEADGGTLGWKSEYKRDPGPHAEAPFAINHPYFAQVIETIVLPHKGEGFTLVGGDIDRVIGAWELKRKGAIKDGVFTMTASTRSIAPEIAFAELKAAEKPLAELAHDTLYVMAPYSYKATVEEVAALAKSTPTSAEALIERGVVFLNRGDLDKAVADLTEALRLQPRSSLALANRGMTLFWKGDLEAASADADKALEIDPAQAVAYNVKGLLAQQKGEHDKAIVAYTRGVELWPASDFAVLRRAGSYAALEKYDQAIADIAKALKNNPANADAYHMRAQILQKQGKNEEALADADKMVELADSSDAHLARGNLLLVMGRKPEAKASFEASLALEPTAAAYIGRSQTHAAQDRAKAFADLDAALKLEPEMAEATLLQANFRLADGDAAAALETIDRVIKQRPDDRSARAIRESALLRLGRHDEALASVNAELAEKPNDPLLLNRRCWIRATTNEALDSGLADCDAALKVRPDFAAALDSRGLVYLRRGSLDLAIADYDAALKLSPRMGASLFGRGVARLRKGRTAEGQADLAAARAIDPKIDERFAAFGVTP